ncbi:MAG: Fe-S cluster assembly protein SufD [Hyphomicrobiales bacterium]|nr:Fe-S cluster assembly protein SufD [Hyphomicrobiales bacterium]
MNIQTTRTRTAAETALIDTFAARLPDLPGDKAVIAKRREAIAALEARGLPNRKVEAWHYTDLRRLLTTVPAFDADADAVAVAPLLEGSTVLSILNGKAGKAQPVEGVTIVSAAEKMADGIFAPALQPATDDDAVGAINAAFAADGWFLDIADGAAPATPIEIQSAQAGGQVHTRLAARVGEGAKATVVERHVGTGDALASSVTNIVVGDDAELRWLIVQEQPVGATQLGQFNAWIGKNAKLTLFIMNLGGRLVRQEIRVDAKGEGGEFTLRGVNLLAGSTHCDVTMVLDHSAFGTKSTEVIRNIVTDKAEGAFQGQIRVAQQAQKTDAKMACNTLLLSDEGGFSVKPELEIFADDVVCGHGATVAEIDRNSLFYLMARGIEEKTARGLLVKAFLAEVIEGLEDEPIVEALEAKLDGWFAEHG